MKKDLSLKKFENSSMNFSMLLSEQNVTEIYKNDQNALTKTQFYARSHLHLVQTAILTVVQS